MNMIKDQAVCLRTRNFSESSQILTFFARSSGKVQAIAKGSRRGRARFGVGIELLSAGAIVFYPPRNESSLATLGEFELENSFPLLRQNMLGLYCAQYAAELLVDFTEDLDPHEQLYDALYLTLENLPRHQRPEVSLLGFELTLLREIGLAPSWDTCSSCARKLPPRQRLYFSSSQGGMLCRDCEGAVREKLFVEPEVLDVLCDLSKSATVPRRTLIDAHELLSYHQRELLGKQTKIMVFLNQLLRQEKD
jgi:DNA repair protein RecO (recombination protein O)